MMKAGGKNSVVDEMVRQLIYNLPPSEGLPDVRPDYPRYQKRAAADLGMSPELYMECAKIMDWKLNKRNLAVFGDGDGSAPVLESGNTGSVRNISEHPVERVRRTFGDGSGTLTESYHAPLCKDLNCKGCGPVDRDVEISNLEHRVVEAAIAHCHDMDWPYPFELEDAVDALIAARQKEL